MLRRELPPTAGLPAAWRDFLPPWRRDFASDAASWLGSEWSLLTSSGTAALCIALSALSRLAPKRRHVVLPAYTCPLVAEAVLRSGLTPRLCDTRDGHFDFDPDALTACCDDEVLVVVATHLAGRVADVALARRHADACGAFVIEDAAQAFGARVHDRGQTWQSVGHRGDIGIFSFSVGKGLTLFEGGLVIAKDERIQELLAASERKLQRRAPLRELQRATELIGYAALYHPKTLSLVYGAPLRRALARGDVVSAVGDRARHAIPIHRVSRFRQTAGTRALARYQAHLEAASERAAQLRQTLAALPGVKVLDDPPGQSGIWMFLILVLSDEALRNEVLRPLWGAGLGVTRLFAMALPDYPQLKGRIHAPPLPHARAFAARTLTLGNSAWLDPQAMEHVLAALRSRIP